MFTLQECFVAYGSKFPFTVTFHVYNIPLTFTARIKIDQAGFIIKRHFETPNCEWIWIHNKNLNESYIDERCPHATFALTPNYTYEEHLYKKFKKEVSSLLIGET